MSFDWLPGSVSLLGWGALTTLCLTMLAALAGTILSIAGAVGRRSSITIVQRAVAFYVELIRNTPFLVQLFFLYFGLPSLGIRLSPFTVAVLAMTINLSAYGTEIVAAGLDAVSKGQHEAGMALGMRWPMRFVKIVLPQALRIIYPALVSQIIIILLESAVVSQISVYELTAQADMIQSRTFRTFETYLVVTLVYLVMSIALRRFLFAIGRKSIAGMA